MKNYLAIDGGTTNTRVSLVSDGKILATVKLSVGARKSIGGKGELEKAVSEAISDLLKTQNLSEDDIECAIASGMITSEYGLCKLDHLVAPVGIAELHNGMKRTALPEIANIPFFFIPGVKLSGGDIESTDMMRGEETEVMGIESGEGIYVLPGSHSKLIRLDADGKITDIVSMLTGEMMAATVDGTILKDSVTLDTEISLEAILQGYLYCEKHGVNASLFKVRVMKNLLGADAESACGFFKGIMLHDEIKEILKYGAKRVTVGGKRQLREPTVYLIKALSDTEAIALTDEEVASSTVNGMIRIYEYKA